jgi:hypothetical protein
VSCASLSAGLAETAPTTPGAAVGKGAVLARGAVERDLAKVAAGALQCLEGLLVQKRRQKSTNAVKEAIRERQGRTREVGY